MSGTLGSTLLLVSVPIAGAAVGGFAIVSAIVGPKLVTAIKQWSEKVERDVTTPIGGTLLNSQHDNEILSLSSQLALQRGPRIDWQQLVVHEVDVLEEVTVCTRQTIEGDSYVLGQPRMGPMGDLEIRGDINKLYQIYLASLEFTDNALHKVQEFGVYTQDQCVEICHRTATDIKQALLTTSQHLKALCTQDYEFFVDFIYRITRQRATTRHHHDLTFDEFVAEADKYRILPNGQELESLDYEPSSDDEVLELNPVVVTDNAEEEIKIDIVPTNTPTHEIEFGYEGIAPNLEQDETHALQYALEGVNVPVDDIVNPEEVLDLVNNILFDIVEGPTTGQVVDYPYVITETHQVVRRVIAWKYVALHIQHLVNQILPVDDVNMVILGKAANDVMKKMTSLPMEYYEPIKTLAIMSVVHDSNYRDDMITFMDLCKQVHSGPVFLPRK